MDESNCPSSPAPSAGGTLATAPRNTLHLRTASLDLGAAARNITLSLDLPADRWILFLGGPQMGPALLFWGVLLVVLALAWGWVEVGLRI